jgi:hypothetical protein
VGTATLTFTSIEVTGPNAGDYSLTNTCGSSLVPQAQCTLSVTFTPSAAGTRTASVVFTDNAAGSPQTVNLTGTGLSGGVGLSAGILTFGSQLLGTSAPAQTVTVTNNGNATLTFTSITVTGANVADFPETSTCGSSLAAQGNCTISVIFTPTAVGSRTAAVTISDSAAGGPQIVTLTGTGSSPTVSLTTNTLTFPSQNLGTTSAAQSVTLNNTGNAALNIAGIAATGANASDFTVTNNCGASVAALSSCTISVTFTPASAGSRSASVAIFDNAAGSPQLITLTGTGVGNAPVANLSTNSLTSGTQSISTSSPPLSVMLSNTGNATLNITSVVITGTNASDFSVSANTCGSTLAAGGSCTISVTFMPSGPGTRTAILAITDDSGGGDPTQDVNLSGMGTTSTVSFSASTLTFAGQAVGTTSTAQAVILTNTGGASLTISSLALAGANAGDFGQNNNCGSSVVAGGSCTINVTFTPSAPGARTAAVAVTDNATGSPQTVNLTGTGGGAAVSLNVASITFSSQTMGTTSVAQPVTLSNTGTAALNITSVAVTGANASDFAQINTCGSFVPGGGNCTISVTFSPTAPGSRTASVTITDNAAGSPQTVLLTGTGSGPVVSISPSTLNFSNQSVGSTSAAQTLTLNNTGNATLTISGTQVIGANAGDFSQANTCGSSVAAGGSCTISVTFTPTAPAARSASLTLTDNATSSPQTVNLTGTGTGPLASIVTSSLTFNNQNVGTKSGPQSATLNNTGTAALSMTSIAFTGANPGDFAETNTCGSSVAAGGSCTISVTFTPTASGSRTASLTITDNSNNVAGSQQTVSITGTGAGPAASFNPPSLLFGSQTQGTTSTAQGVTLTNTGTAALILTSISVTGTNASDFSEADTCGGVVTVNGSCTINVTFTPSASGSRTASVSVADNASGSPQSAALTGTGLAGQVSLAPSSLTFASQAVGTTSNAQSVTVTNTGNATFTISGISLTGANPGDYSETTNCGSSLVQNASCTIIVKFSPTATGIRQASISIADSLASSPQTVSLTGTGSGAAVSLSPATLTFAALALGATSAAQTLTLTNTGTVALTITNIGTGGADPGDFAVASTCPGSVAVNGSCTISVTFTPAGIGSRTASIAIADNANGSPQTVNLTGTGSGSIAGITASILTFSSQNLGTTSSAQTFTLSNTGNAPLVISAIAFTGANPGDFADTTTCGSSLAASGNCTISVTFTPAANGTRMATLSITDNSNDVAGSQQSVSLVGTGTGPAISYAPTSLAFTSQTLGTTSAAQVVALSNTGNAPLNITSLVVTGANAGDFSQTNTCAASVAAGGNCLVSVTFAPTALGNRSASISITDNATGSPQSVALTGAGTAPLASLSAANLNFGNQGLLTTSASQAVTLSNTGNVSLSITSIAVTGANSGDFSQNNTCGNSVASGGNCTVTVTFMPSAVGSRAASISLTDSAAGSPQTVSLTGTGTGSIASLTASALTFSSQALGSTSPSQVVTVNNTGNVTLNITAVAVSGANSGDFAQTNSCGSPVAAGSSCTISVTFTPAAPGSRSATVTLTDDAAGSPQAISLTGTGSGPIAGLSAPSLSFSSQNIGATSAAQVLTLSNTGNASLTITSIALSGTNPGDYAQTNTCGSSVAASSSCTINLTFTPTAPGPRTATLTVTDNSNNVAGSTQSASLTGTGTGPAVSLSPASLTFTSQSVGTTSASQSVTLTNTGNANLTFSSFTVTGGNSGDFAETNTCPATLTAGVDCTVTVTFTPAGVGSRSAAVSIMDSASTSPQTIGLTGTGSGPLVSLTAASLTFASQSVGTTSPAQTVTVNNTGNATLNISTVGVSGANSGDFGQSGTCGSPVPAGSSCTISVTFTPTGFGSRLATVNITDNAAGSPQAITLTGTGSAPFGALTPTLTFASQNVGSTSAAQTLTLNNNGNASLSITGITLTGANSGDYAQTNTCGSSVAASSSCTISVTFTPAAPGTRTATLTVTDNSNNVAGSTQSATLTGTGSGPSITLTPSSLSFGSQGQNTTSAAQSVMVTNNGNAGLTFSSISITGTNSTDFALTGNTCTGGVTAGGNCSLSVTFTPSLVAAESAAISLADNAPASPQSVGLSGTGTAGQISFSPASLTFSSQNVGTQSSAVGITVTNTGTAAFTINSVSIAGANAGDFSETTTCGGSLGIGLTCNISVTFKPQAPLTRTASVSVADTLASSPQTVGLTGTGAAPLAGTTAASLTFNPQNAGSTSSAQTFTLNNTGNLALTISNIGFTGANPGDFGQTNTCAGSVSAGGSCTISVTFTPTTSGSRAASLNITDNNNNVAGSQQSVSLTGTGNAPTASTTAANLTFTSQNLNTTSTAQTFTLNNTGNVTLSITGVGFTGANPGDFGETNTCGGSVAAGGNCTVSVTFTPTATGSRTATLNITDNNNNVAGSQQSVSLTGTGSGATVGLNPATLNYAIQPQGTASAPQGVTLTNTGNANLTFTSITVTGTNAGDFGQTNTCVSPIAPNGTCTITVTFTPGGILSRTASLSIADNASGSPQSVTLTGTGSAPIAGATTSSLNFSSQNLGSTSTAQTFTLNNSGNATLTISSIGFTGANPGDFGTTNTCAGSVAASSSCTISVTFTPTAPGNRTASLIITDNSNNAAGSQQSVSVSGTGSAPIAGVGTGSLTFVSQTLNTTSSSQAVTLNNTGNVALTISSIGFTGANPADFGQTNTCAGSVAANSSCTINVTFTPTAIGSRAATLSITDNSGNVAGSQQSVTLTGTGTSPIVSLSATSLNFASQTVGTTSTPAQSVTLTNTGNVNLTITSVSVTGANPGDFAQTNTCVSPITPNGTCSFSVTFTPTAILSRAASISIADNAPGTPQLITLTGTGNASIVSLSATTLTFAAQAELTTSPSQTVNVTNTGNLSLTISSIGLTGSNAGDFTEINNCPASLAAGSFCTITVTFTPSASGSRTAAVSIADNATAGSPQAVSLIGTGVLGSVGLSATVLTFGSQAVGTTSTPAQTVTLTNGGSSALTITSIQITGANPGDFAMPTNTCVSPLAVNGTCTVGLTFSPTTSGSRAATLTITDSASNSPQTLSMTGTGTAPEAGLSPSTFAFANTPDATPSSPTSFTLNNTGNATLNIASIVFAGTDPGDFSENTTCGATLAANSTCTIAVTFTPAAGGSRSGTLVVTDNNNNVTGSTQSSTLAGAGLPDVLLNWDPSPTAGILGYNVFRGTTSGGESTTPIATEVATGCTTFATCTYADTAVVAGTKYYYYVTAVGSNGTTQSAASNEASATAP